MTMPTPQKIGKYAERLVAAARGLDAEPDNMKAREAYMRAAFNLDWTATAVVSLADALDAERTSHAELQARAESADLVYQKSYELGTEWRTRAEAAEARATTAETALAQAREALERKDAEIAALKQDVVAFCAPWAIAYAREQGLPPEHLFPSHYDTLERCGARMVDFTRAALRTPEQKEQP